MNVMALISVFYLIMKMWKKTFVYPTVFEKFVTFQNQDAQCKVKDDLNNAKEEEAKLNNLRKLFMAEQEKKRKSAKLTKATRKR